MPVTTCRLLAALILVAPVFLGAPGAPAAVAAPPNFVVAWAASVQGPYPVGNPTAQPELRFAFPDPAKGASDQTFRLIVRPDIWGKQTRIRLSNAFGSKPVTFDSVEIGLQQSGAALVPGTNRTVSFKAKTRITVGPGGSAVSDPVRLPFIKDPNDKMLVGRRLAVSFHVSGDTGPMTWHAKALTTSYISPPGSGDKAADETEKAFPYSSTSWYFLDALDMTAPAATKAIVAFGDSITDGTASTINGDDRWPDVFARHVHALYGDRFSVVNAGIGGNMVIGPADYKANPFAGGPAATQRLDRDVISLSGVKAVIWLEGINDFGNAGAKPEDVENGVRAVVKQLRAKIPGVRVSMATLTSALDSTNGGYGAPAINDKRQAYNQFIRSAGIFDDVIDFDAVTIDAKTGELKAEYQPNSSVGGPGDKLHPNRAGYMAMGLSIDPSAVTGQ
ncbi:MAG TPA: GDSL-type esterase/lipase family protein [Rhodopila sp.]|jgi:lysophospholipase L1-like esterase|nr:GDSL-type esterase/lipase family protein [Rhodopila sp.]